MCEEFHPSLPPPLNLSPIFPAIFISIESRRKHASRSPKESQGIPLMMVNERSAGACGGGLASHDHNNIRFPPLSTKNPLSGCPEVAWGHQMDLK